MSHDEGFGDMFDRLAEKAGMSPGSLVHVGDREIEDPVITVIEYDQDMRSVMMSTMLHLRLASVTQIPSPGSTSTGCTMWT